VSRIFRLLCLVAALAVAGAGLAPLSAGPAGANGPPLAATAAGALEALRHLQALRSAPALAHAFADHEPELGAAAQRYSDLRRRLAGHVATIVGLDPAEVDRVWLTTSERRLGVIYTALAQVGRPYRRVGASPARGFDCSGLTMFAWSTAGVSLPHLARSQMARSVPVDQATAKPGDLAFYPGHIMLYLGVGEAIVHAPRSGTTVSVKNWARPVRLASPLG
jgi:cell wall-associated NlpC family hydrolase